MIDQIGVLSDAPALAPLLQDDEDLDSGMMLEQPAAANLLSRMSADSRSSSPLGRQLMRVAADQASRCLDADHQGPTFSGTAPPGFHFESCAARRPPATNPGRFGRDALVDVADAESEAFANTNANPEDLRQASAALDELGNRL